ncbi:Peptidase [Trichinella pseudospiralis]
MDSLWNTENRRHILPSVMSMNNFQRISRIIRFDDRKTTLHCPMMCNPGAYVTADKRLILFKGSGSFRQYILKSQQRMASKFRIFVTPRLAMLGTCRSTQGNAHQVFVRRIKDAPFSTGRDCKPEMILDYNATKRAVGNLDKMLASYTCEHMTARWPLVQQRLPIVSTLQP